MEKQITQRVEECFIIAEKFFGRNLRRCSITFEKCSPLGYYNPNNHTLNFNPLYYSQNMERFLYEVVPHEVAHAVDKMVYGLQSSGQNQIHHGRTWKYIMTAVFKLPPDRCCTLKDDFVKPVQRIRNHFLYSCSCAGKQHSLSSVVHNRIRSGWKYTCNRCRSQLSFIGQDNKKKLQQIVKKLQQLKNS